MGAVDRLLAPPMAGVTAAQGPRRMVEWRIVNGCADGPLGAANEAAARLDPCAGRMPA